MSRAATPALRRWAAALGCVLAVGATALAPARADSVSDPFAVAASATYGTVKSIDRRGNDQPPHGTGAVVGGLLGAVVGRQIADDSRGKNVGAAIGAAAGAFIGHEIEKNIRRDQTPVRITVTLDDGSTRRFDFKEPGDLRPGDRVRVDGNMLYRVS